MSSQKRFTDEFKRDAVAQVIDRGYAVSEVAERLGVSTKSLYTWKAQFAKPAKVREAEADLANELRRLKKELARVTVVRHGTRLGSFYVLHRPSGTVYRPGFDCSIGLMKYPIS